MKKILVVSTVKLTMDGIINVLKNYYFRMNKNKFEIEYVFPAVSNQHLYEEFVSSYKVNLITRTVKTLPMYVYKLFRLIKQNKYDIVHIHGNSATMAFELIAAFFAGTKVRIVHSHNTTCSSKFMHKVLSPFFKKLYTNAFACGEMAGNWLFGKDKFKIINNGVDLSRFSYNKTTRNDLRKQLHLENKTIIGHVGAIVKQKNHEFLIDVMEQLYKKDKSFHLLLVGNGSKREEIEQLVIQKGLQEAVTFAGIISNTNDYYQAFDVFVLPSLYEGLPLVSVEAQASGLPCFISDTVSKEAGVTSFVQFYSLNSSSEEWADAIIRTQTGNREENSIQGVALLKEAGFDIEENVKSLEVFYERVTAEI